MPWSLVKDTRTGQSWGYEPWAMSVWSKRVVFMSKQNHVFQSDEFFIRWPFWKLKLTGDKWCRDCEKVNRNLHFHRLFFSFWDHERVSKKEGKGRFLEAGWHLLLSRKKFKRHLGVHGSYFLKYHPIHHFHDSYSSWFFIAITIPAVSWQCNFFKLFTW